ncbi:MAG: hypothetical protein J7K34_05225 [Flavobacteriaceae bacterium]|nr:hypothetical protein [Flavobacteriaceae bacterium]
MDYPLQTLQCCRRLLVWKIRYDNDYTEWLQYRNRIDTKDYKTLINRIWLEKL